MADITDRVKKILNDRGIDYTHREEAEKEECCLTCIHYDSYDHDLGVEFGCEKGIISNCTDNLNNGPDMPAWLYYVLRCYKYERKI